MVAGDWSSTCADQRGPEISQPRRPNSVAMPPSSTRMAEQSIESRGVPRVSQDNGGRIGFGPLFSLCIGPSEWGRSELVRGGRELQGVANLIEEVGNRIGKGVHG